MRKIPTMPTDWTQFESLRDLEQWMRAHGIEGTAMEYARKHIPLESVYQRAILAYLRTELPKRGYYVAVVKLAAGPYMTTGWPDVHALIRPAKAIRGWPLYLEVKRPLLGEATPGQLARIEEIRRAGGIAAVVRGVPDVKRLLVDHGILDEEEVR